MEVHSNCEILKARALPKKKRQEPGASKQQLRGNP